MKLFLLLLLLVAGVALAAKPNACPATSCPGTQLCCARTASSSSGRCKTACKSSETSICLADSDCNQADFGCENGVCVYQEPVTTAPPVECTELDLSACPGLDPTPDACAQGYIRDYGCYSGVCIPTCLIAPFYHLFSENPCDGYNPSYWSAQGWPICTTQQYLDACTDIGETCIIEGDLCNSILVCRSPLQHKKK